MEVPEGIPCRSKLHHLLVNELNHIGVTTKREAMVQGFKDSLAEAFELGFQAAKTGMKCFLPLSEDGFDGYDPPGNPEHHSNEEL